MSLNTLLISYWKLDQSSGNAIDSLGLNNLTNINTVTYSPAVINNGANFVKASQQVLKISDGSQTGLDISGSMTIAGWVKIGTIPVSTSGMFVSKAQFITSIIDDKSYQFGFDPTPQLFFNVSANGTTYPGGGPVSWSPISNTWYHVGVVYDSLNGTATYYVNGSQQGIMQTGLPNSVWNSTSAFDLGSSEQTNVDTFLDGSMDEWGIWNRQLSAGEISQLYNGGIGLSYPFTNTSSGNMILCM